MPINTNQLTYLLNTLKELRPIVIAMPTDLELKAIQDELIAQIKLTKT